MLLTRTLLGTVLTLGALSGIAAAGPGQSGSSPCPPLIAQPAVWVIPSDDGHQGLTILPVDSQPARDLLHPFRKLHKHKRMHHGGLYYRPASRRFGGGVHPKRHSNHRDLTHPFRKLHKHKRNDSDDRRVYLEQEYRYDEPGETRHASRSIRGDDNPGHHYGWSRGRHNPHRSTEDASRRIHRRHRER